MPAHLPLTVTLAVGLAALVTVAVGQPVAGCALFGGALVGAGAFRALSSGRAAGLLQVRGRTADSATLVGLGLAVLALTISLNSTYQELP